MQRRWSYQQFVLFFLVHSFTIQKLIRGKKRSKPGHYNQSFLFNHNHHHHLIIDLDGLLSTRGKKYIIHIVSNFSILLIYKWIPMIRSRRKRKEQNIGQGEINDVLHKQNSYVSYRRWSDFLISKEKKWEISIFTRDEFDQSWLCFIWLMHRFNWNVPV